MNCREFRSILPEYLYSKLSDQSLAQFLTHAKICKECSKVLQESESLCSLVRKFPPPPFTPEEKAALRLRVRLKTKRKTFIGRDFSLGWRLATGLAAAVIGLVIWVAMKPGNNSSPGVVEAARVLNEELNQEFIVVGELCSEIDQLQDLAAPIPGGTVVPGGWG